MKKVIKSQTFFGQDYRYEVHWISDKGADALLGGSRTLDEAERIAIDKLYELEDNPFMSPEEKLHFADTLYIYDSEKDADATTYEVENVQDSVMSTMYRKMENHKVVGKAMLR